MEGCYDPLDQNEEPCWHCPNFGNTWTPDEIQEAYKLLGIDDETEEIDNERE